MGSVKSCCSAPQREACGPQPTMTTFSSELQKLSIENANDANDYEFNVFNKSKKQTKNSINNKSTRKLSEECVQRFGLSDDNITDFYDIGEPIGHGKYGSVHIGKSLKDKDLQVAIKIIKIRKIKSNFEEVMKEIQMLRQVSHPDIVKIMDIYQDPKKLYLVMEYISGDELFDFIVAREKLEEGEARLIIDQLIQIVKYLNSINICHRDLKPENIMINPSTLRIKLLDFGLSSHFNDFKDLVSPVGTPYYVPPEVLRGKYNKECDMWSIGIITFILLTGAPPFQGDNLDDIYSEILHHRLVFEKDEWEHISDEAREFVAKLIEPCVESRLSPHEALAHQWIVNEYPSQKKVDQYQQARYGGLKNQNEYRHQSLRVLRLLRANRKLTTCDLCNRFLDADKCDLMKRLDVIQFRNDCKGCLALKNIINLVELYTDAKIEFDDFLIEVLGNNHQVQLKDIRFVLSQLEMDTIIEERENSSFNATQSAQQSSQPPSFVMEEVNSSICSHRMVYKSKSTFSEDSMPSKSETASNNTFKEYTLDTMIKGPCKHEAAPGKVRCRKLCKQPTLNYICLANQATVEDEKNLGEVKACGSYLKNYEGRYSSIKFSVCSSS